MKRRIFDWHYGFAVDLRSLALFRIAFGICLFIDNFYRLFFIDAFYTDKGVLPRDVLISQFSNRWEWSLNLVTGSSTGQTIIFAILLLATLGFIFGFYTRLCAFICLIIVCSIQARNHVVTHGGDDVFRSMLLWCQFLPLAAEFSLDKYLNPQRKEKELRFSYLNMGTVAILLQLCCIYIFTAILKWHPIWHTEWSGVYYALSLDQFASPLGKWITQFPPLMQLMTISTLCLEFFGPFLVLLPIYYLNWRIFAAVSFIGFHLGLALTMMLGMFPWTCMAAWLIVLPASFWEKMKWWKWRPIYGAAEFLKKYVTAPAPTLHFSWINQGIAAFFLIVVMWWNITHFEDLKLKKPDFLKAIANSTFTYQKWSMFAPYPRKDDGWFVIEGDLIDGRKLDIWNAGPHGDHELNFDIPLNIADTYRNTLWRKYLTNIWLVSHKNHRLYFGRYLCRMWNDEAQSQDEMVNTIQVHFMLDMTPKPGESLGLIKKETIWRHYCFDKPDGWE